jgi:uncharacterized protein with ParB-like and HNH nuclease domain
MNNSIRKFVRSINNYEEDGGFWLPNIQRTFVWNEEQIERLFDSILREYPIGNFLVWKTKEEVKMRKFIDNYRKGLRFSDYYEQPNKNKKILVLDGQQRIQSLYIGLLGSYEGKELCIDLLSGDLVPPDEIKYRFKFLKPSDIKLPYVKLKDIVFSQKEYNVIAQEIISSFDRTLNPDEQTKISTMIAKIYRLFTDENVITYQMADSIDKPELYTDDDIVEIFIRANSGGTPLSKSDLLFSLLMVEWDEAQKEIEELLEDLNRTGYKFNRDFILKTSLCLIGEGAKYEVKKFRKEEAKKKIIDEWENIVEAIKDVKDFIYSSTYLKDDKTLPSYLALIPLIYFRYKFPDKWRSNDKKDFKYYILRVSLTGAFSGTPDNLIDQITKKIDERKNFEINEIFTTIKNNGRSLEISKEKLLDLEYNDKEIHLIFNMWYGFNYQPSFNGNLPQIDHIFPQSELKKIKDVNQEPGGKDSRKYSKKEINQIANLMLLTAQENGAGGKSNKTPEEWFLDKNDEYLDLHLIPKDKELWKIEKFEQFIEWRKKLIVDKFDYLITKE